ncbi:MAG TPA: DUF4150 domain-containing protein [Caldilineaceae bacterium]|nr:DUF4150 domain-containing protein [Caldilineaceae bacterium]
MSKPLAPTQGIALAFPDVCKTQIGPATVPIPYPNIAQLDQATGVTDASGKEVLVGPASLHVLLKDSEVATSTGDEAGALLGVQSNSIQGKCRITQASASVVYGPQQKGVARFMDSTQQNIGPSNVANANGFVLATFPTVLVGD